MGKCLADKCLGSDAGDGWGGGTLSPRHEPHSETATVGGTNKNVDVKYIERTGGFRELGNTSLRFQKLRNRKWETPIYCDSQVGEGVDSNSLLRGKKSV